MAWYDQYFGGTTTPTTGGTTTPTTGRNQPPGQRVWEENRRDETPVSVDYTAPTVDTSQPIRDVAAEQDAIDDAAAMALPTRDVYTPEERYYGPGSAIPGQTGYAYTNITPGMVKALGLDQIDTETAAFFGYKPGSQTVPNELYQQYIEGSIVSGNEAVETKHLYDTGQNWADYKDFEGNWVKGDPVDPNVGTWGQVEGQWNFGDPGGLLEGAITDYDKYKADIAGFEKDPDLAHPLMTLEEYYGDMSSPFTIPINQDPWDSWEDPWYRGYTQGGGYNDSMADLARHTWFSESLSDVEAREQERMGEGLGIATMMDMEKMYDRSFAAKASPLFDPEFSFGAYEDVDPIYAGMDLFKKSRMEAE